MIPAKIFNSEIKQLYEMLEPRGGAFPDMKLRLYYESLGGYDQRDFLAGCKFALDNEFRFPVPATLKKHIEAARDLRIDMEYQRRKMAEQDGGIAYPREGTPEERELGQKLLRAVIEGFGDGREGMIKKIKELKEKYPGHEGIFLRHIEDLEAEMTARPGKANTVSEAEKAEILKRQAARLLGHGEK